MNSHTAALPGRSPIAAGILAFAALTGGATSALAETLFVPDVGPLAVAIAIADPGDTIVLRASGSPYTAFPGFDFGGKQLILSGETGDPDDVVLDAVGLDRVLTIDGSSTSGSVVEHVTIRGGGSVVNSPGLYIRDTTVTIENCIFEDNGTSDEVATDGGAMRHENSNVTVLDCIFRNNRSTNGAAAVLRDGTSTWTNCIFENNESTNIAGGLYSIGNNLSIEGCEFTGNSAAVQSGGIRVTSGSAATINATLFRNNHSVRGGAIRLAEGSTLTVTNSVFCGNSAEAYGGDIYTQGNIQLLNCSTTGATADLGAGGPYEIVGVSTITARNCIIRADSPSSSGGTGTLILRHCNAVEGGTGDANGNFFDDTGYIDPVNCDLRLADDSPAIDRGDTLLSTNLDFDFDGNVRGMDDPNTPNLGVSTWAINVDIGAFEFQPEIDCEASCAGDSNNDGNVDFQDLVTLLGAWGSCP